MHTKTDTLALCECCALMIANNDETGCRDHDHHTHKSVEVPARTVLTDECDQPYSGFICDGCGERQGDFAYRVWAVVLTPMTSDAHDLPDSESTDSYVSHESGVSRFRQIFDYANPYRSDAYALDPKGHGWDRLTCIAGEYERGEIGWEQAIEWCDDNARDLLALMDDNTN